MPLDHYVTLGRSGLRVSPFCLGAMTFGEDLGWGSSVEESEAIMDRYLERGGNFIDTANIYTKGHSEKIIGDYLAPRPARARPAGHRHQVLRQPLPRRPQRRRRRPQGDHRRVRAVAAPPADRLHRPLLAALLGQAHADRRDDARARRPRARRQGPLHRLLRHAGVEGRRGAGRSRASAAGRRSSRCRSSTRCSSAPSRGSSMPMARELGLGVTPWSPLKSGVAERQVHARERASTVEADAASGSRRALNERPTRSSTSCSASREELDSTRRRVALAWVQARPGVTSTIIGARRSTSSRTTSARSI